MSDPLFTIVTPNFNSGEKLALTCRTVAEQTVDYEHLILDGGSTDGSRELGAQLAAADPRIRLFSQRDDGVYDAMNKGIASATGRFLYFLGAGDALLPESLSKVASYLPRSGMSFVYGNCLIDGKQYSGRYTRTKLVVMNICHQSIFYGRDVFTALGVYNLKYRVMADWEFNFRCFASRRVRKIYMPVAVAQFEPGGLSASGDSIFEHDKKDLIRKHFGVVFSTLLRARPQLGLIRRRVFPFFIEAD